ncbi:MAG TPA: riboflavin biosynthesis protein RibF [candidate division Zixibacteria bacterium]|nr:riboflavin biosynthesis protein RibF [candidate division Zixibacteria bacterium]
MTATAPRVFGIHDLPPIGPAALVMGAFDGVHVGHAAMLAATREAAARLGVRSVALVFEPHPDEVLRPGTRVPRLAPLATTLRRIVIDQGLDHAVPLRFDDHLRSLTAEEFLAAMVPRIEVRALVMSPESAFGRDRGGTVERMREHGAEAGFEVVTVEPVLVDGEVVSSTRQRAAIAAGDVPTALALGYPPRLEGTVVEGDHRGRELGYPTANLAFDYLPAMPANGIYVGEVAVPERDVGPHHPALVSVGVRPTFHADGQVLVEAHLLDFDGDLYGAHLALDLLARLRDEQRFDSVDALVGQMHRDEVAARAFLLRRRG